MKKLNKLKIITLLVFSIIYTKSIAQTNFTIKTSEKDSISVPLNEVIYIDKKLAENILVQYEECEEIKGINTLLKQDVSSLESAVKERTEQTKQQFEIGKKLDDKFRDLKKDFDDLKKIANASDVTVEDYKNKLEKAEKKNDKRVSIGVYVGYGIDLNFSVSAQIGVGIHYRIFRL